MRNPSDSPSRRTFLQSAALTVGGLAGAGVFSGLGLPSSFADVTAANPLQEFGYGDVTLTSELHEKQLRESHALLMELSDDSLLKPLRKMAGQPAPGEELGGWYLYDPNYDYQTWDAGFAPGCTFGQWVSALARAYAITGSPEARAKVLRLNREYAKTISADFYIKNRFPAYCYDKFVLGLIDSHRWVGDPDAMAILQRTTDIALPHLPGKAIEHDQVWRPGKDVSFTWDESYTISENLFLAYQHGAGDRYRDLGKQYLDDEYYGPLAEGKNVLAGRHAYSYVNSLSSAMQAYFTLGSQKHFRAAKNAFDMLVAQSYATGGWGPDEQLRAPDSDDIAASLSKVHHTFETPCGSYAHFKLTRYLLRATRDSRYGDSMEQVMYNTILGAKPMQRDGRAFYYSDYHFEGHKVFSDHRWPCCSGTFPQVAADYRINTYLRDPQGVYVNLYIPSTLRWTQGGTTVSLTQKTEYPLEETVRLELDASAPTAFTLNVRVPFWTKGAEISINGKNVPESVIPGTFVSIRREWKTGDQVELHLPMDIHLQPIDTRHPNIAAVVRGPLVLFALTSSRQSAARSQLLAAKQIAKDRWQADTTNGPLVLLPFWAIDEEQYSTYLDVT